MSRLNINIPPGVLYLIKHTPHLLFPPVTVYVFLFLGHVYFPDSTVSLIGGWTEIFLHILSLPLALTLSVWYTDLVNAWNAWKLGAVMAKSPSLWEDPTPGGFLSILRMSKAMRSGYPAEQLRHRLDTLGHTFNMRILFTDRIFTAEPEHIKAFLATQFEHFEKGEDSRSTFDSLLGTGVFAADGDLWKFHRTLTRPFFNRDRISHFDIFDRHAEEAISQMRERFRQGWAVDFQEVVSRFTIDSATEFLFGKDIGTLNEPLAYPFYAFSSSNNTSNTHSTIKSFAHSFTSAQMHTFHRARWGKHWPLVEFWKDRTKEEMKGVRRVLDPILVQALERKSGKQGEEKEEEGVKEVRDREVGEGETLLDHLINYTDDPVILRDEIMNLAVAGRDTTASILTFTMYMLSQHPEILRKLREEVLQKIGGKRRPTYEDFREMRYLRAVLNETLRLYPPVPFNMRQCKDGALLPPIKPGDKPIYVPPGTRCAYSVLVMHRRPDLWGPTALDFDPDRFLDSRVHEYLTPNPFIFLPFNAGPRICLGQQFAYHEASFFLVRLLQRFGAIELVEEAMPLTGRVPKEWKDEGGIKARERVQMRSHLTMYVVEGLWLKMEEAEEVTEEEV
ncbi:cytochrome P450 [Dendrothele bispora CBS 962.96]|uniref:Cytochrome P450 n=1 Tax=Dendrothele bispora (strain CBS 962.96) TaxID=1314807 RepID=A0A4S8KZZ0_DENBC|nr:cytochrome P450 [Dendrothele bispora CBS 962.96]